MVNSLFTLLLSLFGLSNLNSPLILININSYFWTVFGGVFDKNGFIFKIFSMLTFTTQTVDATKGINSKNFLFKILHRIFGLCHSIFSMVDSICLHTTIVC
jgi:hypothetical protein